MRFRTAVLACTTLAGCLPSMALAQSQGTDVTSVSAEADQGLGEIIVTAQRRSESAQSVPISLQSFSGDALTAASVDSTEDLTNVVGGLIIVPTAARPMVFVRGIGTNSSNTTPAILTFIDGVYQPFGQSTDLANLQSVEVLKGPQGTLFGRNATGGVIQITTKPPSETPGAKVDVGYGNYSTVDATAYVTGGLANGLAADVALKYSDQGDGFGTNVFNGDDVFATDRFSGRSRLRAVLSDDVTLTIAGNYSQISGTVGTNVSPAVGQCLVLGGGGTAAGSTRPGAAAGTRYCRGSSYFPGDYDINAGPVTTPFYRAKEWGVSGTLEANLGSLTGRSITAFQQSSEHSFIDIDGTPATGVHVTIDRTPRKAFTQELQLLSGDDTALQWVVGAFYYHAQTSLPRYSVNANSVEASDKDDSISGYGQATYEFLPETKLTLGARYTHEKRSVQGLVRNLNTGVINPGSQGSDSQTFNEVTWRVALDHKLTRNALIYASVSRGFNAGFFNANSSAGFATRTQNPAVLPEFLTAYEVGAKTDLFDRRLRFNVSGFWYDYKGLQQQVYVNGSTVTINAGSAEIKGIDLELVAQPIPSLTLSLNGTYLDSKYTSYAQAPNYVLIPTGEVIQPIGSESRDAAGKSITNAPELSYTFTATHVLSTSIGTFETTGNVNYRGKTFIDAQNNFRLPTRYVVNLTERWNEPGGNFFVSVWAKNLLDKRYDYAVNILAPRGLVGQSAPPRTYGATFGFSF
jgi:iron complex outermembrane recepter protein